MLQSLKKSWRMRQLTLGAGQSSGGLMSGDEGKEQLNLVRLLEKLKFRYEAHSSLFCINE
jgi:hypothetical protein